MDEELTMPTPEAAPLSGIPMWLAWIPGIAALVGLLVKLMRRPINWLLQRPSREELTQAITQLQLGRNQMMAQMARENAATLKSIEEKWDLALRNMSTQRKDMHRENLTSLNGIYERLNKVEQRVAGVEGEMKERTRRRGGD